MSNESSKRDRRAEHIQRRRDQGLTHAELADEFGGVHRTTIGRRLKRMQNGEGEDREQRVADED